MGIEQNSINFNCDSSDDEGDNENIQSTHSNNGGDSTTITSPFSKSTQKSSAETDPQTIKKNTGLWADGKIGDSDFLTNIRTMINSGLVSITNDFSKFSGNQYVPGWFHNTAGWWTEDLVSETEFYNAVKFLVEKGVIRI